MDYLASDDTVGGGGGGVFDPVLTGDPAIEPAVDLGGDLGRHTKRFKTAYVETVDASKVDLDIISSINPPDANHRTLWFKNDLQLYLTDDSIRDRPVTSSLFDITDLAPSTGLIVGGLLSLSGSLVNIGAGSGIIVTGLTSEKVAWDAILGNALLNPTTAEYTVFYIDYSGTVLRTNTPVTPISRREAILLGIVSHPGTSTPTLTVSNVPNTIQNPNQNWLDLCDGIGLFNLSGNVYSGNTGLTISKTGGSIFRAGSNYQAMPHDPNRQPTPSVVGLLFILAKSSGVAIPATPYQTNIDPTKYDAGGLGTLQTVSTNQWTIQVISLAIGNTTIVEYGQATYNSQGDALGAVGTFKHVSVLSTASIVRRSFLVVRGGATNLLLSSDAVFIEANRFGQGSGSSSAPIPVSMPSSSFDFPPSELFTFNADYSFFFGIKFDTSTVTYSQLTMWFSSMVNTPFEIGFYTRNMTNPSGAGTGGSYVYVPDTIKNYDSGTDFGIRRFTFASPVTLPALTGNNIYFLGIKFKTFAGSIISYARSWASVGTCNLAGSVTALASAGLPTGTVTIQNNTLACPYIYLN